MNFFQKFISRQDTAISRWRTHVATVKAQVEGEDRKIREIFDKLSDADRTAKELMQSEPCVANLVKSVDAGARRLAAKQAYEHYSNGPGMYLHERIEKALDFGFARAAVKELRTMIESRKAEAIKDAEKFARDNALDPSATIQAVEKRFAERLSQVAQAETCLANTERSTPDRRLFPSGLTMLANYIEAAVAGD